jgi:hypothetical protein
MNAARCPNEAAVTGAIALATKIEFYYHIIDE